MASTDKKTAVLVALVKSGVVDLDSLADGIVKRMPAGFDTGNLNPDLGASAGGLVGRWFVLVGEEHLEQ